MKTPRNRLLTRPASRARAQQVAVRVGARSVRLDCTLDTVVVAALFFLLRKTRRRGLDRASGGGCCARTAAAALMPVHGTSCSCSSCSSPLFCSRCSSRFAGEVCNKSLSPPPPPPLPLSLSLFLAGSKSLVFACSCCEHCVCAFVISEVQCSEV